VGGCVHMCVHVNFFLCEERDFVSNMLISIHTYTYNITSIPTYT
jgi:hypothetical protein